MTALLSGIGVISLLGLGLSLWVVLPAPTALWLPLAVATPELSPWLVVINLLCLGLGLYGLTQAAPSAVVVGTSAIALVLSLLPLVQFGATQQAATAAMAQAWGADYRAAIPASQQRQLRSAPLVWADLVRGIPTPPVRQIAAVPFAAPAGEPLTLDIYQPPQVGLYPAIVLIYGGAWQRGQPQDTAALARYLAAQGYVVWALDYRHAPAHRFPAQLQDVRSALAFLRQHAAEYESDPERIALVGKSAGAHLAMLTAYQPEGPPVQAVVNYYGPVNLLNGYYDLPTPDPLDVRSVLETFLGGAPAQVGPERYRRASPSHYLRAGLPPTLLVYGRKDRIVMAKFGRSLATRLQADRNPAALIEIPWADHAFDAIFNGLGNQLALYHTERFLAWALGAA